MTQALYYIKNTTHAGQGLFAIEALAEDTRIGSFSSQLTAYAAARDPNVRRHLSSLDFSKLPALSEKLVLTLYLALLTSAKYEETFEAVIDLRQLPTTIQNGVWSQEKGLLQSQLGPAIAAKQRVLERQWHSLASQVCSFEMWKWADSIISSRCIGLSEAPHSYTQENVHMRALEAMYTTAEISTFFDLPEHPDLALVPGLDLSNHAGINRNTRWDVGQDGTIYLIATKAIDQDQEITISYGDEKTNAELFFNYGFTLEDNSNWSIDITVPAPSDIDSARAAEYWAAVSEMYGLTNTLAFKSDTFLNTTHHEPLTNKIMGHWVRPDHVRLSQEDLGILLLSLSVNVLEDELLVRLFAGTESLPHGELVMWNHKVTNLLHDILTSMVVRLDGRECYNDSLNAARLLRDERRAYVAILNRLKSDTT